MGRRFRNIEQYELARFPKCYFQFWAWIKVVKVFGTKVFPLLRIQPDTFCWINRFNLCSTTRWHQFPHTNLIDTNSWSARPLPVRVSSFTSSRCLRGFKGHCGLFRMYYWMEFNEWSFVSCNWLSLPPSVVFDRKEDFYLFSLFLVCSQNRL